MEKLLEGGVTIATLDSVLAAVRDPAKGVKPAVLLPPASSMAVLRAAQEAPEAKPAGAAPSPAEALAAAAGDDSSGGGLFDE